MMRKIVMITLLLTGTFLAKAQDEETFSDEDLKTYATVMIWAEEQQPLLSERLIDRIKSDSVLEGSRYNDLKKAYGDEAKLQEIEATDEEILAYETIVIYSDSIKADFKETYVDKIKNDITVGLYNKLKSALKSDEALKARYDEIVTGLKETKEEEEETTDSEEGL